MATCQEKILINIPRLSLWGLGGAKPNIIRQATLKHYICTVLSIVGPYIE